jgi:hypothetical protein
MLDLLRFHAVLAVVDLLVGVFPQRSIGKAMEAACLVRDRGFNLSRAIYIVSTPLGCPSSYVTSYYEPQPFLTIRIMESEHASFRMARLVPVFLRPCRNWYE